MLAIVPCALAVQHALDLPVAVVPRVPSAPPHPRPTHAERHPLLQHTVRTAAGFAKSGKLGRLLAMVVALQRTYSGQAFVRLKVRAGDTWALCG